jgi:hypothetical protein
MVSVINRSDSKEDMSNVAKCLHRDHPEKVFRDEDHHGSFYDCNAACQFRIGQFEVHKPFYEIVPEISV